MHNRLKMLTATALLGALIGVGVQAADKATENAIGYRQGAMKMIGWHFGPMAAMIKGEIPFDAELFAANAQALSLLSQFPDQGFTPGSSLEDVVDIKTGAKADIWTNKEDFDAKMQAFRDEAAKLAEVSQAGDMEQSKTQLAELGKACKSCHDDYRQKD